MAAKTQHWVRIFEVNETKRHPKGYTIYQVKSTVFPRTSPEASTSVVVWRRYSEISRLHRAISELHEKLGLSGKLPPFPRATILNRFEADVVEARREATLNLLKFIGQHSPLFTSEPFTSFFQNNEKKTTGHFGERRKRTKGRSKEAEQLATTLGIQDSVSLYSQLSESEDDLSLCSTPDYPFPVIPAPSTSDLAEASGSVGFDFSGDPHRSNTTQSVSRMKNGSVGTLGVSEESQRKILSKNLQENHHALQRTTEGQTVKEKVIHDQNTLLSHNSSMDDSVFEFPQGDLNSHVVDPSDLSEKHTITSSVSSTSSLSYCVYENPVHDSPLHQESYHKDLKQPEDIMPTTTHPLPPVNITKSVSIPERKSSVPLTPLTPLTTTVTPYVPTHKVPTPQEVANSQYIFIAAQQISEAQQHEQQKDYKKALNMYREGVGTLLQGVQGDNDGDRRDAVKRKTAQYLQRAEQLVARLTRRDKKREQFLDGPEAEVCSGGEGDLKCSATDLARYKVVGWTGSVIIATDTSNGDTVAIKVHVKSGIGSGEKTVIPREVPFMVPVMRYHETDTAIYLVLKYISGGKLWSHIKKYVEAEENFYNTLHGSVTTTTYSGRRLLQESMEYDRSSAGHQTPHNSHVSHLSSASLLNIPTCTTTRANSECSDVSSTCLPDAYLQIYSEYDPTLPSSSSMLILPHNTHNNHTTMDSVPKSLSTGALSGTSVYPDPGCAGPHDSGKSVAENKVTKDYIPWPNGDNMIEEDKVSIGSDTLSGVSEDFSCSLPVGVPDLLPDTVPLPEVRITADSSVISSCNELPQTVGGKESRKENINGYLKGESQRSSKTNNIVTKEVTPEDGKELLDTRQLKSPLTENGGKETVSPTTAVSPTAAGHLEPDDENSITDTSFASITLPSFSWAKQEESEVASLDIEDLIRNSRQLLQNVDHTLLQSRSQSVIFPISGESSSGDQSELPNDNGSINQDQPDKKGVLDSQTLHEKKSLGIKLSKSNSSVRVSPLMARRLGLNQEGHRTKKSSLKCTRSENNLSTPQKFAMSVTENNKIDLETGVVKQIIDMSLNGTGQAVSQHSEQSQDYVEKWSSESKESLSLAKCDPPSENSLAALLEKYSASRGQDSKPRLPEGIVKVWLSQIISAVSSLHHQGIVLGDLNPDDILLDEGGSILMTHVSRWSSVQQGVWKARGVSSMSKVWIQRGYLAPELISPVAHPTSASDWWSIGALMYHLLTGQSLSRAHPSGITSHTELLMPPHLTPEAVSLLSQLLCVHPTERLGGGGAGVQEVKDHPFFTGIQWAN